MNNERKRERRGRELGEQVKKSQNENLGKVVC